MSQDLKSAAGERSRRSTTTTRTAHTAYTKRIKILAGKTMPYHTHAQHTETITVISGMGKLILEGTEVDLLAGSTVSIASGKKHSIKALGSDLRLIEVSLGVTCDDEQVLG